MDTTSIITLILLIISEALAVIPTTYPISGILQGILSLLIPSFAPTRNGAAIGGINPTTANPQNLLTKLQELEMLITKNNNANIIPLNTIPIVAPNDLQSVVVK